MSSLKYVVRGQAKQDACKAAKMTTGRKQRWRTSRDCSRLTRDLAVLQVDNVTSRATSARHASGSVNGQFGVPRVRIGMFTPLARRTVGTAGRERVDGATL
jgi:hypothetical protein